MNKLFVVALALIIGAVVAAPSQRNDSDTITECFNQLLEGIDTENEELRAVLEDAWMTIQYLRQRHQRCQELPRDDPPTRLQQIAIDACENAWRLNVAIELARLTAAINEHGEGGRDLIDQFAECSGIELPRPEA